MRAFEEYETLIRDIIHDYLVENLPALFNIDGITKEQAGRVLDAHFKEEENAISYRQRINTALLKEMNENYDTDILKMGRSTEHMSDSASVVCNLVIAKVRDYDVMWQKLVDAHPDILLPHLFKDRVKECFVEGNIKGLSAAAKYL